MKDNMEKASSSGEKISGLEIIRKTRTLATGV